ncbi:MAG TPA: gamma-glutamyltransferase family protein [Zeimonas sp.]|nr:gamma-glutamyltransferase family protein [Zeimonas sp.]
MSANFVPGRLVLAATIATALWIAPAAAREPAQPEASSGYAERSATQARRFMAVTANPHASRAARDVLAAGGSAIDAAIAAQMVLTLVEPQSSGIGGGGFLLHYDAGTRMVRAYDGRETAPSAATPSLFVARDGVPMAFFDAMVGGRSVGVPGLVRMLELAHRRHGRLPWQRLFEPAIRLARDGFDVSPRLHALLERDPYLREDPAAAALFYDAQGRAWPVGQRLRNAALADTLSRIATTGSLALHAGEVARDIVAAVRTHPRNPGLLGERDLAFYRPLERAALCTDHRRYRVCGMPPPSSGGIAIAQMLAYWRASPASLRLATLDGRLDAAGVHRFTEAARLAFADRDRYVADPAFVALPGHGLGEATGAVRGSLLDPRYLAARAALIGERSMVRAAPGAPDGMALPGAQARSPELAATTHLSIVDARGNAVSMTSSIENAFGARVMVRGFLLNNQLTDFSFAPEDAGAPVANRVQPGKRPRSSMSPTIVLDRATGALVLAIGSPGGPSIVSHVARVLIAVLDDGLDVQRAISLPNVGSRNGPTELERGRAEPSLAEALARRGHPVELVDMTSGLHGIARRCAAGRCRLEGGVDPRREGLALGR